MPASSQIGQTWCSRTVRLISGFPNPAILLLSSLLAPESATSMTNSFVPVGRSLNSCQNIYHHFAGGSLPPALTAPPTFALPAAESSSRKRPYPTETFTPTGRVLKPKPATFPAAEPSRLSMSAQGSFPLSPLAEPAPSLGEPRKKRGRPTKKEQEERRKQMELSAQSLMSPDIAQSGQPPPVPPVVGPSTLTAGPFSQIASTPQAPSQEESTNSGSSSGKKRRGRPPKPAPAIEPAPPFTLPITRAYESPPQTSSTRDRRGSISTRSETTVRTQASLAPESATAGATAGEQSEDTRRATRPRIWEQ